MSVADISVIMVVRNGEKYLAESIESVLNQSISPSEILLIDGNSTDNTIRIASEFEQVKILTQKNEGLANARNLGIETATSRFITFLDHDDIWPEDTLEIHWNAWMQDRTIMYSYGQVQLFYDDEKDLRYGYHEEDFKERKRGRTPGTLFARRSLFRTIGGFNPVYSIACDVDWFTKASDYSIRHVFIPKLLLYKRIHRSSLSSNVETNRMELFRVIRNSLVRQKKNE